MTLMLKGATVRHQTVLYQTGAVICITRSHNVHQKNCNSV